MTHPHRKLDVHPKVAAASLAGALTTLLVFILTEVGVQVPVDVATALTAVLAALAGYVKAS